MSNQAVIRLQRELLEIRKNPDQSIYIWYDDKNITNFKSLIVGPPNTPYANGQFEFALQFPSNYPDQPPKVSALTTNYGKTRFNPNIYAGGKVCLSILGTWRGESSEQWSSAHGISSVLLSIQSLMSDKPYHNEPGFEDQKDESSQEDIEAYNLKIQHETIRISICDRLENFLKIKSQKPSNTISNPSASTSKHTLSSIYSPVVSVSSPAPAGAIQFGHTSSIISAHPVDMSAMSVASHMPAPAAAAAAATVVATPPPLPGTSASFPWGALPHPKYVSHHTVGPEFEDLSKRLFLCYYETYLEIVEAESQKVADGIHFKKMPFEGMGNSMDGNFNYTSLRTRLAQIHEAILAETDRWLQESKALIASDITSAANLKRQFEQAKEWFKDKSDYVVEVDLLDGNPFVWDCVVFGKPMSQYDGGLFRLRLIFHETFPDTPPRVRFTTPIFHPHITDSGVPYYRPRREDDVKSHLEALASLVDADPGPNPASHVNRRAAALFFGSKDDRREFGRQARRCAARSVEY